MKKLITALKRLAKAHAQSLNDLMAQNKSGIIIDVIRGEMAQVSAAAKGSASSSEEDESRSLNAHNHPIAQVWAAYSTAYESRYGTPPVRNAAINGQLKLFVHRIPINEAAHIAAFFIVCNDPYYVRTGHQIKQLVHDAEKLRTQWKTGNREIIQEYRRSQSAQAMMAIEEWKNGG